jgi:hypothetical protein
MLHKGWESVSLGANSIDIADSTIARMYHTLHRQHRCIKCCMAYMQKPFVSTTFLNRQKLQPYQQSEVKVSNKMSGCNQVQPTVDDLAVFGGAENFGPMSICVHLCQT